MKKIFVLLSVILICAFAKAQPYAGQQRVYTIAGVTMLGWFPDDYGSTSPFRYPLILHFNGAGATDSSSTVNDGSGLGVIPKQLAHGTWDGKQYIPNGNYINDTAKYIVFSFANVADQGWPPAVDDIVTALLAAYRIDSTRMILAGWSQGATDLLKYRGNVFEQGLLHNEQFRKIFPIATGNTGLDATNWSTADTVYGKFYVGSADMTTGTVFTNGEVALINANSPSNSYGIAKIIEGAGHDVTDTAYQHDELQAQYNAYIWFISDTAGNIALHKINVRPYMAWGINGNYGTGSQSLLDTSVNKWGNIIGRAFTQFDGDADPDNGEYDMDTTRVGFQNDTTLFTGVLQRPNVQNYWDMGIDSQIVVILDLGQEYSFNKFYYWDTTGGSISNAADITFGTAEDARALAFEFEGTWGSPTPDYTINASSTAGWKQVNITGQTGQFIIIRFNRVNGSYPNEVGAAFSSFMFYGDTTGNRDTRITPSWNTPIVRDTCYAVSRLNNFVEAHPTPSYSNWRTDTAANWGGLGGYISAITTTSGTFDRYDGAFGSRANTNVKWNATPYNVPIYNTADTTWFKAHRNYQVDRSASTYFLRQTDSTNLNWIPLDSLGADFRLGTSYERYMFQFLRGASRLCYEVPDTTNNIGLYLREDFIENNPHSGRYAWGLFDYYIPFNENWAGYRSNGVAGSNYMSPKALFEFHDKLKRGWDSVFTVMPFVSQGFAAWGMEGIIEAEFIGRLKYLNKNHPIADILNMHPTISTWFRDRDYGCEGSGNSQAYLAGVRNEMRKMQVFIDTMQLLSGLQRRAIVTEIAVESHYDPNFAVPDSTCSNGVSGLGAKQIGSDDTWTSQAKTIVQANLNYYFTTLESLYSYEMMDAADTAGLYYNQPDGAAGRVQGYHNWYKPAFFAEGQQHKWLNDYRGAVIVSDSTGGNFAGILRNVNSASRDSFCLAIAWGSYTAAASARTYLLWSDVTGYRKKSHVYSTDWTFDGTTVTGSTSPGGVITETPEASPIYYFFKSPALAAALDNYRGFPVNLSGIIFGNP